MNVGAFSVSLSVKDLDKSKEFYEKIGFEVYAGKLESNYLIMKNKEIIIGLFQNMFEGNILTFNPGWDQNANILESFDDVRTIYSQLKSDGIDIQDKIESESGPASFSIADPDGNQILFDQHV